jgi:two-component system NtrC family sensor kinase
VKTEQQNSLRVLRWMMAASLAFPLALFVYAASASWVTTLDIADREIERTVDVAHEHALKVFETIDRSLSEINEMVRGKSDAQIKAEEQPLYVRLKQLAEALPQVKSAWVFDARGHALANSMMLSAPTIDFSDRDYFQAHLGGDKDIGTFIGRSLLPRPPYQGAPFFSVSRRRESAAGSVAGVIQASVLPEYFADFYARIGRDPGSFFALGLVDGSVLVRYPAQDGATPADPGPVGETIAHSGDGLITVTSPSDGIERRLGYQQLAGYPIYVAAGLETSAIRARWLTTIGQHLVFGIPATALLFLLLLMALRRTRTLNIEATKRREAEDALKHGQRLEALGQLTGGVAHDFNNLLTVIRSSVDLLQRPDLAPERRERYVAAISETVNRAAKLTAQLLAFARRQTLKPEVFDVGQCVRSVSDIVGTLTGSLVEIVIELPDDPLFIDADVGQFETALINIAVNACDAMKGEGRLTISVRAADDLPDVKQPSRARGFVAVSVSDTGIGIPADQFEHIFEPFFTTKEVGQGTGLGLSQVFGFAKQSGGELVVESTVGHGSTFTLYLPRVPGENVAKVAAANDDAVVDGHGMSVLVVEDNRDVGQFAVDALGELGYATVLKCNATDALAELSRHAARYAVVFSDVVMPGMTGIEMAQEIRKHHADLPVVLTSGYSHVLAQNGTFGFELLQKPYSIEQLSRVLSKVGRWRRGRRDIELEPRPSS